LSSSTGLHNTIGAGGPIAKVVVIGAGSWGTTVANLLAQKGLDVTLCPREADLASCIARSHENSRYLPGVALSPRLNVAVGPADVVPDTDLLVFAIPAQSLREVVRRLRDCVTDRTILLNVAKGIEEGTGSRCSEIILDELKRTNPMAVLSGPNIAWEVALGVPSKAVVSCSNYRYLAALRDAFSTGCFKVYENSDLAGTELGGALKNVIAIMAGIGDGLGYGVNTKAAVITRGLKEMVRIGVFMGGHRETFFGLSGIGDLMATSLSDRSRNRTLGEHLGRGATLRDAEDALNGRVAEGVKTTKALFEIKSEYRLDLPIVDSLYRILYDGLPPSEGFGAMWYPGEGLEAD